MPLSRAASVPPLLRSSTPDVDWADARTCNREEQILDLEAIQEGDAVLVV